MQIDGAKYHKTPQVKDLVRQLRIPIVISAPYSWDGAPAELFFAMWKRDQINIQKLATSKSKYQRMSKLPQNILAI